MDYWVFTEEQLDAALDAYVNASTISGQPFREADKTLWKDTMKRFLRSTEARAHKLIVEGGPR